MTVAFFPNDCRFRSLPSWVLALPSMFVAQSQPVRIEIPQFRLGECVSAVHNAKTEQASKEASKHKIDLHRRIGNVLKALAASA
jgi:hypothetical protein